MDWYEFCTLRHEYYLRRNEYTAAMVYWVMRFMDSDKNMRSAVISEEGCEQELGEYWEFKYNSVPHMFD